MKEYTITLSFSIEAGEADYERISEFAEELVENIMNTDDLIYNDDIEIVEASVEDVEDNNEEIDDDDYPDDEL